MGEKKKKKEREREKAKNGEGGVDVYDAKGGGERV